MTTTTTTILPVEPGHEPGPAPEKKRRTGTGVAAVDLVFRGGARAAGTLMLVVMGGIGVFLAVQAVPTLRTYGWGFFTESEWNPEQNRLGIAAVIVGTVSVAAVAIAIAVPLALLTALYITEYAPRGLKRALVSAVDLMAAVPSVVYGLVGLALLQPQLVDVARWLHGALGWIPVFRVGTAEDPVDPGAAIWAQSRYTSSAFIAGVVVSLMVLPIVCSVMREVFSQAPQGEREAAWALGGTRWGVVRTVVLPFARGGIIGGTMLGLGRALGETIAVVFIISPAFDIKLRILENGTITTSSLIAVRFGDADPGQLSALLAAGLVLFLITLAVNTLAAVVVSRSRSGAATEI